MKDYTEIMARDDCDPWEAVYDAIWDCGPDAAPSQYRDAARAALSQAGMVIVPAEPTEAMIDEMAEHLFRDNVVLARAYRAAIQQREQ